MPNYDKFKGFQISLRVQGDTLRLRSNRKSKCDQLFSWEMYIWLVDHTTKKKRLKCWVKSWI